MQPEPIYIEPDAWCEWCGDPLPEIEERHPAQRFCSRRCKDDNSNARKREEWAALLADLDCPHCGTRFKQNRADQIYCTAKCGANAAYRRKTGRPVARQDRDCPGCGTGFTPRNLAHKFCTTPCRVKAHIRKG